MRYGIIIGLMAGWCAVAAQSAEPPAAPTAQGKPSAASSDEAVAGEIARLAAKAAKYIPLQEGFVVNGCSGVVKRVPDQDRWFFIPETEITDGRGTHLSEHPFELLPCGTLEKITSLPEASKGASMRLWARVVTYKAENFLYPIYFIPTTAADETPPAAETKPVQAVPVPEPNDVSIIPANIRSLLKPKQVVNLSQVRSTLEVDSDAVLAGRSGFVMLKPGPDFQPDGFGRNVEDISFHLLRCTGLEATESRLASAGPTRQRYKVAGIITRYKGQYYLLLQRATRTYTHGNFTP
jgi:hypothetical protein